jgi:2-hydroxychromene-2-carboxylate isomerase
MSDITFYFDPVCPFAWMTSKWVRMVAEGRDYDIEWKLISLRMLNSHIDYDAHFPPEYEAGHNAGLRMLRMAAKAREEHGAEVLGDLYQAFGDHIFEIDPPTAEQRAGMGRRDHVEPILAQAGLPSGLADALEEEQWDEMIRAETDEALALTGKDVGTPIINFHDPGSKAEDGRDIAFFGPVISRLPSPAQAGELWDHVVGLAAFEGFSEMKRSLRELPQLKALGVSESEAGRSEDWHEGSRRQKK